ncbi:MAG TPA: sodium-independent anion transporter, partial [Myxococcota bacterium]|nr:sodium-independent anion transporter [Myxococcota bacterium]
VYHFGADLFYANVARFETEVQGLVSHAPSPVRLLLVDAGAITSVDFSAARSLRTFLEDLRRRKVTLALVHVDTYMRADLDRHRLIEVIGADMIFDKLHDALASPRLAQHERAQAEASSADPASN